MTTMMKYIFFKKLCAHFLCCYSEEFSIIFRLPPPSPPPFICLPTTSHRAQQISTSFIYSGMCRMREESAVRCGVRFIASHPKTRNSHSLCEMCIDGKKCVENRQLIIAGKKYHKISYFLSRFIFVMVRMFREELRGEWDGEKKRVFHRTPSLKGKSIFLRWVSEKSERTWEQPPDVSTIFIIALNCEWMKAHIKIR